MPPSHPIPFQVPSRTEKSYREGAGTLSQEPPLVIRMEERLAAPGSLCCRDFTACYTHPFRGGAITPFTEEKSQLMELEGPPGACDQSGIVLAPLAH